MANDRTITAANAVLMIGVQGLYDVPRRLQGFAADNITDVDALAIGEGVMGVDGRLSAGYVFNPISQNITVQADSESIDFFENWIQAEAQRREKYIAFGSLLISATRKRYTMTRGFLMNVSLVPAVNKTLQARRFTISWEALTSAPN